MAENLLIGGNTKAEMYATLIPQIESLVATETDLVANMANVAACLKQTFNFWWVGFYRTEGNELVLGPFQGPLACTRIKKGRGVCGTAWAECRTVIVPNVDLFDGHIACSSASKSEIVVPIYCGQEVVGVLDVDSEHFDSFDEDDRQGLEKIVEILVCK